MPLLVPKPGALYRFTAYIRLENKFTIKYQYPLPSLTQELTKVALSLYFADVDFLHGCWQLALALMSHKCQQFIMPDGIFTPSHVLHGTTYAIIPLQSSLAGIILEDLKPSVLCWLDDVLIHEPTVDGLLQSLESSFKPCVEYNFKHHRAKCTFFATSIYWHGCLLSANRIHYDTDLMDSLLSIEPLRTKTLLQQSFEPCNGSSRESPASPTLWPRSTISWNASMQLLTIVQECRHACQPCSS